MPYFHHQEKQGLLMNKNKYLRLGLLLLMSHMAFSADDMGRYLAFQLSTYGNQSFSNGKDSVLSPLDISGENDLTSLTTLLGSAEQDPLALTLDRSILDSHLDETEQQWTNQFRVGAGNQGLQQYQFAAGGMLGNGPFSAMVAVNRLQSDGFNQNSFLNNHKISRQKYTGRKARLNYSSEDVLATLDYAKIDWDKGDDSILISSLPVRETFSDINGSDKNQQESSGLNVAWHIGAASTIKSETRVTNRDEKVLQDIDRTELSLEFFLFGQSNQLKQQKLSYEYLNETGELATLGIDYQDIDTDQATVTTGFLLAPIINQVVTLSILSRQNNKQYTATASKDWKFANNQYLALKLDYFHYQLKRDELVVGSVAGLVDTGGIRRATQVNETFQQWLPNVYYNLDLDSGISFYSEVSQNYAPGGVSLNLVSGVRRPYDEELETRVEMGLENLAKSDNTQLGLSIFYSDFNQKQITVFGRRDNPYDVGIINADSANAYGANLSLNHNYQQKLLINANITWQKTEYKNLPPAFATFDGNEFIATPRLQGVVNFTWILPHHLVFSAEEIFQDSLFSDVQNTQEDKLDARVITNLKLGYERKQWGLYLWGANVFDSQFFTYKSTASDVAFLGIGASYGVTFEAKF